MYTIRELYHSDLVNGPGGIKDIMSMDCQMVVVKWVGEAWGKWLLVGSHYQPREMKRVGFEN